MTAIAPPTEASQGSTPVAWLRTNPGVLTLRWVALVALTSIAFWRTIVAVVDEMRSLTIIICVPVLIVLAIIAAIGKSWRRAPEPPIYDRQTDVIVGLVIMLIAVAVQVMVNPRYGQAYLTTHMDLLALWLFFLAASIVMFGLRPVSRYRWVWLLALLIWPVPVRVVILTFGGGPVVAGAVMVVLAAVATLITVGRSGRRGAIGAGVALIVGMILLFIGDALLPGTRRAWLVVIPAIGSTLVASITMYVDYRVRHRLGWTPLGRGVHPPTLARVGRPAFVLIAVSVLLAFVPVPVKVGVWPSQTIPGMPLGQPLAIPADWRQESVQRYPWVTKLYGSASVMYRQLVIQAQGSPEFDKQSRPRRVAVDSVDTARPLSMQVYPYIFRYDLVGERASKSQEIPMPHGVRAWMWSIVDDARYLSYTVVSWWWNNGSKAQQVILWAVDNHEDDANFVQPQFTIGQNLNTMFTVLFRGNASIEDSTPTFKDRDLLQSLAWGIVDVQVDLARQETGT
ncbi:hypothetical protein ABLE92_24760 [Gordonia sp. VNQ95]|uniref:hypothetical protein n=1 Tax=Gordonia sp. VNQ95 TaxID=3156619 RepID=UPI0032B602EC